MKYMLSLECTIYIGGADRLQNIFYFLAKILCRYVYLSYICPDSNENNEM